MWFFRRKKAKGKSGGAGPPCPHCRSTHTELKAHYSTDQADYVRVWRGQRYLTCRCLECGQDFYVEETAERAALELINEERLVDDEEELQAAEDELKRQVDDEGDRRCR